MQCKVLSKIIHKEKEMSITIVAVSTAAAILPEKISKVAKNLGYAVTIYQNPISAGYLAIDALNTGTTTSRWLCRGAKAMYALGIIYFSSVPAGIFMITAPLL